LILVITLFLSISSADAKKSKPQLDPQTEALLLQLGMKPELMSVDYLQYFIGPPEVPSRGNSNRTNFWYDAARNMKYELHQKEQPKGEIVESDFIAHIEGANLSFE